MNRTKDYRIHQKHKRINRAYNIMGFMWGYKDKEIAKKVSDNFTICSCFSCGNPRHSDWINNYSKLTIQERKALIENT